jgi:hypothetical protein
VVADERLWRAAMAAPADGAWRESDILGLLSDRSLDFVTEAVASNPDSIADLYRSLRKADEDAGNEPAAADFYYGEMEMRRASADCPRSERALLFLYWLVSGYGLRASRAFVALLLTVLLLAIGFRFWGFAGSATFYLETRLSYRDQPGREYVVTLARSHGQTPGELRKAAEARVAELEAELAQVRAELDATLALVAQRQLADHTP